MIKSRRHNILNVAERLRKLMGKKFFRLFALILVSVFICGCLAEDKVVTADMRGGKISAAARAF